MSVPGIEHFPNGQRTTVQPIRHRPRTAVLGRRKQKKNCKPKKPAGSHTQWIGDRFRQFCNQWHTSVTCRRFERNGKRILKYARIRFFKFPFAIDFHYYTTLEAISLRKAAGRCTSDWSDFQLHRPSSLALLAPKNQTVVESIRLVGKQLPWIVLQHWSCAERSDGACYWLRAKTENRTGRNKNTVNQRETAEKPNIRRNNKKKYSKTKMKFPFPSNTSPTQCQRWRLAAEARKI